jgi:phenylacetic acid degradation protein
VGALCFVPTGMEIPERKVVVGNPARVVKDVSDEMLAWKTEGTRLYQALPAELHRSLKPCEPLREVPADRARQAASYKPWAGSGRE